ncbi:hypothetical protein EJC51_47195 [Streptomyces aquilus]|uniref:Uncharacterized protein n=1 Tax=Streptomyces aquilus TaxID=2548456 RepID=A0A3S9HRN9_9ACTN|nr:hypothetical protein [Streptomyces aquilus]AZP14755.1 hypothetical protein EJC51_00350 [Streptomyces aquilus]AZP22949.1 hypothetical protein EJC51_47195 [Streptomyces aquilus]
MDLVEGSLAAAAALFTGWAAYSAMDAAKTAKKAAESSDHNGQTANRTAELAAQTAESVAQIERDRWHRELTPRLRVRVDLSEPNHVLVLRFEGPGELGRLQVRLSIRDDRDHSDDPVLGADPEEQRAERAAVIWGPLRFRQGVDRADAGERTAGPFHLEAHDERKVTVQPSMRPRWYEGASGELRWEADYRYQRPLRLWADCEAEGHKPWRLPFEVSTTSGAWAVPYADTA